MPYHRNRTVTKRWGITNQKQRTLGPESPGWEGNVKGGGEQAELSRKGFGKQKEAREGHAAEVGAD